MQIQCRVLVQVKQLILTIFIGYKYPSSERFVSHENFTEYLKFTLSKFNTLAFLNTACWCFVRDGIDDYAD